MGFRKKIVSRKAVPMNYFRISSFSFSQSGSLDIEVAGYKNGKAFSDGADPIDEFDIVFHNADTQIKSFFYDLIESHVPLFRGAEKDLTHSVGQQSAAQVLTVQTPRGDLIERTVLEQPPDPATPCDLDAMPGSPLPEPPTPGDPELPETLPAEAPPSAPNLPSTNPENPAGTTPPPEVFTPSDN